MGTRCARIAFSLLLTASALGAASCGGPPCHYPVTGTVLCNGQPAEGVDVYFHLKGENDTNPHMPHGTTDENGVFNLECRDGPGALAGEYVVGMRWLDYNTPDGKKLRGKGQVRMKAVPEDMLGGRYEKPPKLAATIRPEKNELPPFEITRDPKANNYLLKK